MDKPTQISRRTMLKAVPVAATVLAAPDGLLAAEPASAAAAHFPQPPVWASRLTPGFPRPVLDGTLDVRFNDTYIPGFGTAHTRTYNAMIPGPTLRLRAGDRLQLTQVNGLPPNPPATEMMLNDPHKFNSFNLHTHGLHVSPSGTADNVFREFAPRAREEDPEPSYLSTIDIPADHPAGTFWYHPHLHGAVTEQVSGGMTGVLIIEGDVDRVPEIAAAAEVVVCINELKLTKKSEVLFTSDALITAAPPIFTVNGVVNPTIFLRPGEVQRWRLVAATAFTRLPLLLTGVADESPDMYQIAMDGITFRRPVQTPMVALSEGNRADVLVREPSNCARRASTAR
jgi:FtsP/CotA-like multicopper oxidase with cupredoxin domain